MALSDQERIYLDTVGLLQEKRNRKKTERVLCQRGLTEVQAKAMVDRAHRELKWEVRKGALGKLIVSGLGLVVIGIILLTTGDLYYIWAVFAGFGFCWGLAQFIFAAGYEPEGD